MTDLSQFPITRRWKPEHPELLQLYSLNTPNGVKVSIMLEEIGLPYEPHLVEIAADESWTPEFLSLNPNGKIPAIIDPDGPDGTPLGIAESGAILIYLAEKAGRFYPQDLRGRHEVNQWVFWQMANQGPKTGECGHFRRLKDSQGDQSYAVRRFTDEVNRLYGVMNNRLYDRRYLAGDDYTIADIAIGGWVRNLVGFYGAGELVDYASLKNVPAWLERWLERPAVQRGLHVTEKVQR